MITCDDCGKTKGDGDIGQHWICDSCRVPEPENKGSKGKKTKGSTTIRH